MSKFKFIIHHDLDIQESEYVKDEATVDFVNSILAASTISDSDIAGARQIVEATPPMDDMLANPDIQDFLSAFSIPDINNMMGQNFDPDEGQDA